MQSSLPDIDCVVVGGGLVGMATALGLVRRRMRTLVLDEGDVAFRAARGNFALIWAQGKGKNLPDYAALSVYACKLWPAFAEELEREAEFDIGFEQPGGLALTLSEGELERRALHMSTIRDQGSSLPYEVLSHSQTASMLPRIGPDVAGAIYCPLDGHANPLRLLKALHRSFARNNGLYLSDAPVSSILPLSAGGFRITTPRVTLEAPRVVIAAGLGNRNLAPMLGLEHHIRPQRGQIIVTERLERFLPYPLHTLRQTDEGGVIIGDSQEEAEDELEMRSDINATMADRAVRMLPLLRDARVVRIWSALRVITRDGAPIYERSQSCSGAFMLNCHSGVTLASVHASDIAEGIVSGRFAGQATNFVSGRFNV